MMKKIIIALFLFLSLKGSAQHPEVGKPMPDFTLDNITHYKTTKASLKDFKGKWLFLDFWFPGCVSCIKAFPKVNQLQREFQNEAQFILVGLNYKRYQGIETLYEKMRSKNNFTIASAYDSTLAMKWEIYSMPHIIIVDPNGKVYSITGGRDMTADKIRDLVNGKPVAFFPKDISRPEWETGKLFVPDSGKRQNNLIYQSVLTKWSGEKQYAPLNLQAYFKNKKNNTAGFKVAMIPLFGLYNYAYLGAWLWTEKDSMYGTVYPKPILEIRDTSLFEYDYSHNVGKGTFNYSLTLDSEKANPEYVMNLLQRELKNIFNYYIVVEEREIDVWKLKANSFAMTNLPTKGGAPYFSDSTWSGAAGFIARNLTMNNFYNLITKYISDNQPPIFNETGIKSNIDITVDGDITSIDGVKKSIQKSGLDLVKEKKRMKVIVIKDPKAKF